ncbi:MAG: hypothetical protein MdMp014T_1710 [Treponematales bacterium]
MTTLFPGRTGAPDETKFRYGVPPLFRALTFAWRHAVQPETVNALRAPGVGVPAPCSLIHFLLSPIHFPLPKPPLVAPAAPADDDPVPRSPLPAPLSIFHFPLSIFHTLPLY